MTKNKKRRGLPANVQRTPLDPQTPAQSPTQFVIQQQSFIGPIPPPQIMEAYERILPGSADRILRMAEKQSDHRQGLERQVVAGNVSAQTRGQRYAGGLSALLFGGGIYLLANGIQIGGLSTLALAVAGIVSTFIYGRSRQEKERREKQQQVATR
jgi:uncharacterized membrane protein